MASTESYLKRTVDGFLEELSERRIVPGGGSASALAAAVGASLNLMVINYSKPSGDGDDIAELKGRQQESFDRLKFLIDEDCRAFQELMKALSSKKDARKEYEAAAAAPMQTCRECCASMGVTVGLSESGNMRLVTDIVCAAHMLKSAFYSAKLNVEINLEKIEDPRFTDKVRAELSSLAEEIEHAGAAVTSRLDSVTEEKE